MTSIQLKTSIPGPKAQEMLQRRAAALPAGLAKSTEVVVERAEGALVWDVDGNQLLDFAGGIGMINVGHSDNAVKEAVKAQVDKYIHTCALVTTFEPMIELAELLNEVTPIEGKKKTLFANSGAEAVENAVNLAKYYTKRQAVIVFEGAYHGRTHLTMSLTSKYALFKKGYGSFASDIYRLPLPNVYRKPDEMTEEQYLNYAIKQFENALISQIDPEAVAAILIEPVQGEGGFMPIPTPFLQKLRDVATQHDIVLIFDEIQCGMGRTGKLFACQHFDIYPDIITTAKSLGAGMPISAIVGKSEIMDCTHLGAIGGTYGGSPVACAAAIEAVKKINSEAFLSRAEEIGNKMRERMNTWVEKYDFVGAVRGLGPMLVVEFVKDKDSKTPDADLTLKIIKDAVAQGIILIRAGLYSNCIRLLPPLVITDEQLEEGLNILEGAISRGK